MKILKNYLGEEERIEPIVIRTFGGKKKDCYPPTYCSDKEKICTECSLLRYAYKDDWREWYKKKGMYTNCGGRRMSQSKN